MTVRMNRRGRRWYLTPNSPHLLPQIACAIICGMRPLYIYIRYGVSKRCSIFKTMRVLTSTHSRSVYQTKRLFPIASVERHQRVVVWVQRIPHQKLRTRCACHCTAEESLNGCWQVSIPVTAIDNNLVVIHAASTRLHFPLPSCISIQVCPKVARTP